MNEYDGNFVIDGKKFFYQIGETKIYEYKKGTKYSSFVNVIDENGFTVDTLLIYRDHIEVFKNDVIKAYEEKQANED